MRPIHKDEKCKRPARVNILATFKTRDSSAPPVPLKNAQKKVEQSYIFFFDGPSEEKSNKFTLGRFRGKI